MSPALNGSAVVWQFEGSEATEICDKIALNFYTGLPHMLPGPCAFYQYFSVP